MAYGLLILDGVSLLYILSVLIMGLVIMGIIAQRQISRNRLNSARRDPQVNFKDLGRRQRASILKKLDAVKTLRNNVPRLTDCKTISEHSHAPYLSRMIAVDEVSYEIEAQMERISLNYKRTEDETTLQYLLRLRAAYPAIPFSLVYRIAFLYESARYRLQKFDMVERMELKSLLNKFMRIVADAQVRAGAGSEGSGSAPSKRRRERFGGSDGVRLLMGQPLLSGSHSAGEERLRAIMAGAGGAAATAAAAASKPTTTAAASPSPFGHRRRRSDTNLDA